MGHVSSAISVILKSSFFFAPIKENKAGDQNINNNNNINNNFNMSEKLNDGERGGERGGEREGGGGERGGGGGGKCQNTDN